MGFTVLLSDDSSKVKYRSSISQHKDKLSVSRKGEWAPISFDVLDWIDCNGIKSHRAIVTDGDDIGYNFRVDDKVALSEFYTAHNYGIDEHGFALCSYVEDDDGMLGNCNKQEYRIGLCYALADDTVQPDEQNGMPALEPDEERDVEYRSSISQHKNKLSVARRGEWIPISFDVLDYINCDGISSHRAIVADRDDIGYTFNTSEETLLSDTYLTGDYEALVREKLPAWFGTGEYERYISARTYVNGDCEALGVRNGKTYRVGLNYALAKNTLRPDDNTGLPALEPEEKPQVFRHSSISQHKGKLSVMVQGEWLPISFDALDWIDCDGIKSHRATVTDRDDIGYNFRVANDYTLSEYYISHNYGVGEHGFALCAYTKDDAGRLGECNKRRYRIGLDYVLADKTLDSDD